MLTESELKKIVSKVLNENYDSERLYSREFVVRELRKTPFMRKYIKDLPHIPCEKNGEKTICTKIPESVFMFIFRKF